MINLTTVGADRQQEIYLYLVIYCIAITICGVYLARKILDKLVASCLTTYHLQR